MLKNSNPTAEIVLMTPTYNDNGTSTQSCLDPYVRKVIKLAEENGCAYVDVAEALTGEDGCLPEELSFDGVHLNRAGCRLWLDYLRTHSVAGKVPGESASAQTESEEAGPAPAPSESEQP